MTFGGIGILANQHAGLSRRDWGGIGLLLGGFVGLLGLLAANVATGVRPLPQTAAELYQVTNIWTLHFKFTPQEWTNMEPPGGGRMPFGGFRPPGADTASRGPGGPGAGGGPAGLGGPGGFPGPGTFLAPIFLQQGDSDKDGKLSKGEFQALAEKLYSAWDKTSKHAVDMDQLREGLNTTFALPGFGPPGGGGGPGSPRAAGPGPGGVMPGFNLQGPEGKRNGLASAAGIEFKFVHADLEFEGHLFRDVAVRYKGNGTWMQSQGSSKRSLKVDLNDFVPGRKLAGVSKLNLHNCVTDGSWMNEVMSHRLFRDAGVPAPRTAYARVYITVPGKHDREFVGLYSMVENIDSNFALEHFGTKKGALFKPVTPNTFADLGDNWAAYNQTYDPKTPLNPEHTQRVIDFCRLVSTADDAEFEKRLGEFVDLENFTRFMAVTTWLATMDSILGPGQNFYLHLDPRTGRLQFMPWDLDHSFGQFPLIGSQDQREQLSILKPWQGEKRFLDRVYRAGAFRTLYLTLLDEFNRTIFLPERFHRQVDEIAGAIRPSVREESEAKLARFNQVVSGEASPSGPPSGGGRDAFRFGGFGGFMQPPKPIKQFVIIRSKSVNDQVAEKSEGQTLGFGFGGPRGPGGGGGGPGGFGMPRGFGPGTFLGGAFMSALDANKDSTLTRTECLEGFAKWYDSWSKDGTGLLGEDQLRAGINRDLSLFRGGPGFGPPM